MVAIVSTITKVSYLVHVHESSTVGQTTTCLSYALHDPWNSCYWHLSTSVHERAYDVKSGHCGLITVYLTSQLTRHSLVVQCSSGALVYWYVLSSYCCMGHSVPAFFVGLLQSYKDIVWPQNSNSSMNPTRIMLHCSLYIAVLAACIAMKKLVAIIVAKLVVVSAWVKTQVSGWPCTAGVPGPVATKAGSLLLHCSDSNCS